jgi:hypothetical protein
MLFTINFLKRCFKMSSISNFLINKLNEFFLESLETPLEGRSSSIGSVALVALGCIGVMWSVKHCLSTRRISELSLIESARHDSKEGVKALLVPDGIDVNQQDRYGETALMRAAMGGHTEAVQALLEAGANVNQQDRYGRTALMRAAVRGHTGAVQALLEADGIDVNQQDEDRRTALMWAARGGHTAAVQALLEADGIDINQQDDDGRSALWYVLNNNLALQDLLPLIIKKIRLLGDATAQQICEQGGITSEHQIQLVQAEYDRQIALEGVFRTVVDEQSSLPTVLSNLTAEYLC